MNSALVGVCGQQRLKGPLAVVVLDEEGDAAEPVAQRDHREVLPAVAQPGAQAQLEERQQLLRAAALVRCTIGAVRSTHTRAPGRDGRVGGGLPVTGERGHERVAAGVAGLVTTSAPWSP